MAARLPAPLPTIRRSKPCLRLSGAVADKLHPLAAKPIDADIAAVLRGVTDISPKPWPVRFKEWQARDGQIEIIKARVQQDDVIAVGRRHAQAHAARRSRRQPPGDRRRDREGPQDVRHRAHHVGGTDRSHAERARSAHPRARRDCAPECRRAWSPRSASAPCSTASRRWRFRCGSPTARSSSGRFRWAKSRPCSDPSERGGLPERSIGACKLGPCFSSVGALHLEVSAQSRCRNARPVRLTRND